MLWDIWFCCIWSQAAPPPRSWDPSARLPSRLLGRSFRSTTLGERLTRIRLPLVALSGLPLVLPCRHLSPKTFKSAQNLNFQKNVSNSLRISKCSREPPNCTSHSPKARKRLKTCSFSLTSSRPPKVLFHSDGPLERPQKQFRAPRAPLPCDKYAPFGDI